MTSERGHHPADEAPAETPTTHRRRLAAVNRQAWLGLAERYALVALLVVVALFFALYGPTSTTFRSLANIRGIAGNESVTALVALAALVPLIAGEFDISVGAIMGMSSIVAAAATANYHLAAGPAIVLAILAGAAVGAVNGFFVAYLKVNSFIVTLASSTLIGGLVSLYTKDQTILNGIPNSLQTFGNGVTLGVPRPAWVVIVVAAAVAYVFSMTPFGRALTQIGSSRRAARLVGLRVEALTWSSFVGSGALAGVAGVIELTRTGSGNPVIGFGFTLSALSAAFLGTTTIRPGRFNVPGTLVGVLVVAVAVNGLTLAGAADWVEPVFTGAALMFAVALATQLGLRRGGASEQ